MIHDLKQHVNTLIESGLGLGVGTVHSDKPYIFSIENFLSPQECEVIISYGVDMVESSVLDSGVQPDIRKSKGMGVSVNKDDIMKTISSRVAEVVGLTRQHAEPMQLLKYDRGEHYEPHHDTFPEDKLDPQMESTEQHGPYGQRIITAIINLTDDFEGGYTVFPEINKFIIPQQGKLTVFQTADSKGKEIPQALHQAEMVAGEKPKWLCNFWFREHPRGFINNET